jgi:hypothetical protein
MATHFAVPTKTLTTNGKEKMAASALPAESNSLVAVSNDTAMY